jgi:uncharacterized protein (DUF1800 family)
VTDAAGNPNYSQDDVQELARCFTGWRPFLDPTQANYGQTRFLASSFDSGTKTVLGHTGALDAAGAVDVVLAHPAHAPFLITKLWREFISAPLPPATLDELVRIYRADDRLLIAPLIRRILADPLIFAALDEPDMIKPPVVFAVGVLKAMDAPLRDSLPRQALDGMQQVPYHPPNVAGWEGGLSWLNTTTAGERFDWVVQLQRQKYGGAVLPDPGSQTPLQAYLTAWNAAGRPWVAPGTRDALMAFAANAPVATLGQRRERIYALMAFLLGGPDGQVM